MKAQGKRSECQCRIYRRKEGRPEEGSVLHKAYGPRGFPGLCTRRAMVPNENVTFTVGYHIRAVC